MIKTPASGGAGHSETSKRIKHVPKRDIEGAPVTVVEKPSAAPSERSFTSTNSSQGDMTTSDQVNNQMPQQM